MDAVIVNSRDDGGGLLGYAYTCPDMIGGGQFQSFLNVMKSFDQELIVRSPGACFDADMQFSVAPWRILNEENLRIVKTWHNCMKNLVLIF